MLRISRSSLTLFQQNRLIACPIGIHSLFPNGNERPQIKKARKLCNFDSGRFIQCLMTEKTWTLAHESAAIKRRRRACE